MLGQRVTLQKGSGEKKNTSRTTFSSNTSGTSDDVEVEEVQYERQESSDSQLDAHWPKKGNSKKLPCLSSVDVDPEEPLKPGGQANLEALLQRMNKKLEALEAMRDVPRQVMAIHSMLQVMSGESTPERHRSLASNASMNASAANNSGSHSGSKAPFSSLLSAVHRGSHSSHRGSASASAHRGSASAHRGSTSKATDKRSTEADLSQLSSFVAGNGGDLPGAVPTIRLTSASTEDDKDDDCSLSGSPKTSLVIPADGEREDVPRDSRFSADARVVAFSCDTGAFPSLVPDGHEDAFDDGSQNQRYGHRRKSLTADAGDPVHQKNYLEYRHMADHLSRLTLAPDSRVRVAWDTVVVCNTFLAAAIIPLLLTYFNAGAQLGGMMHFLEYGVDLIWPLDVISNFRTGFYVAGEVERNQLAIALNYAQRWLLPDLLTAWPLAFMQNGNSLYTTFCVLKLVNRVLQLNIRFGRIRSSFPHSIPVFIVTAATMAIHVIACVWRLTLWADGIYAASTASTVAGHYLDDIYFATLTLTSVGFGDIVPGGTASKLFSVPVMLLGCTVFGGIITGCSYCLQKVVSNESEKKMSEISSYMNRRNVSTALQRRVRDNLRRHLHFLESAAVDPELLASLSPAMQRELCLSILSGTVCKFPLLRNAPSSFVAELALVHSWQRVLAGDLVADDCQAVKEVIFIVEGCLQVWLPKGMGCRSWSLDARVRDTVEKRKTIAAARKSLAAGTESNASAWVSITPPSGEEGFGSEDSAPLQTQTNNRLSTTSMATNSDEDNVMELETGAYFGEASLFEEDRVYTSAITALTKCELALLPAVEYHKIVQEYPYLLERHQSISRSIAAGNLSLDDLKFNHQEAMGSDYFSQAKAYGSGSWYSRIFG